MFVAAGPFTDVGSINYAALRKGPHNGIGALLHVVKEEQPHLLILLGPFVDERNKIVEKGALTVERHNLTYDHLFELLLIAITEAVQVAL